jgi:Fe-S-cluster containining protein
VAETGLINVCQGSCCARFYLAEDFYTPEYIAKHVDDSEDRKIRSMVIRLDESPSAKGRMAHTCKHWIGGRCAVYEHRPMMCRGYPYGKKCRDQLPGNDCDYSMDDFEHVTAKWWLVWLVQHWTGGDNGPR